MVQGWSQVSQTSFNQILSDPNLYKFFRKFVFFSVYQLQGFFDTYFVVKSHLRVQKFFVEFIDVSKTAPNLNLGKTLSGDIGIFVGQDTQKRHFFDSRGSQSKNLSKV
jgi:hypothetical protein